MRVFDYCVVIEIIISFFLEKFEESGSGGFVIGISGGIDSVIVVYFVVKVVGIENVLGFIMFYYENNDVEDVKFVCESFGIDYEVINIKLIVEFFVF